jgi:hypothetical protein
VTGGRAFQAEATVSAKVIETLKKAFRQRENKTKLKTRPIERDEERQKL